MEIKRKYQRRDDAVDNRTVVRKVVLEGCLGDWSRKSYIGTLAQKARESEIVLYAVDTKDLKDIERTDYEDPIHFVNKESNWAAYNAIDQVDFVFIVAPHEFHCKIAGHWLEKGKLKENGRIFIEKPLDSLPENVDGLTKKYGDVQRKIIAVDHYILKIPHLIRILTEKRGEFRRIKQIRIDILELDSISESRKKTLDEGLILDMVPHVLAVLTKVMQAYSEFELDADDFKIVEVRTGRYRSAPIKGETFAHIEMTVADTVIESFIGKGVGIHEKKTIEISFERGDITGDLPSGNLFIRERDKIEKISGSIQKNKIDRLLNDILEGEFDENEFLGFDEGFEIVRIITRIREKASRPVEYKKGSSLDDILKKFENTNVSNRAVADASRRDTDGSWQI